MLNEKNIIEIINKQISEKCKTSDKCFENDAVLFDHNNSRFLFSIDDFSKEDRFRENDPDTLGWNMAIAGISDILASGGKPLFFGHSLTVSNQWSEEFIVKLSQGIVDAIKESDMTFIGGDLGKSEEWKYTVSVIGEAPKNNISRKGASVGDSIFISGKIGTGNFEAALNLFQDKIKFPDLLKYIETKFSYRFLHSELMTKYASSSIDTSDGVFNGLNTIVDLNNVGYLVTNVPYILKAKLLAKALSLPIELLFFGECGEYELLFTVKPGKLNEFLNESKKQNLKFYNLGKITEKDKILMRNDIKIDLTQFNIRARDYENIEDYLNELIKKLEI